MDNASYLYRHELQSRYRWLRFAPDVEREFMRFLRETQSFNFVACVWIGLALWLGVVGWDVLRYVQHIEGTAIEARYLQTVIPARLVNLLALGGLLAALPRLRNSDWLGAAGLATIAVYCICTFASAYFYKLLGVGDGMAASILILMTVLFPCGMTLRQALPTGLMLLAAYWFTAWKILPPLHWMAFRETASLLTVCMCMMAFGSYLRERGAREQFLLRRLLDWEAAHDPLTGLANRRSFQRHFEVCLAQARRDGKTLMLAILDLDHFKLYNDHYGHKAGDRALQQVALLLGHYAARPMDLAIRLGGEEFGLLSYADEVPALTRRMQHLLAQLQALQIIHEYSPTAPCLTASIGIAQAEPSATTDSLFLQADAQLYRAKNTGRNRVCGPEDTEAQSRNPAERTAVAAA
ncbi:diguanylate cyclase [Pantoea sp. 18069]|uniref:GGDEF domain-containing protein n=1 Tax=Pantoea sp. 18069 TaxID=2681415 RepID=UPI00135CE345|nr:GGDEF domain-containing protein [Pantoea sp. 18069]